MNEIAKIITLLCKNTDDSVIFVISFLERDYFYYFSQKNAKGEKKKLRDLIDYKAAYRWMHLVNSQEEVVQLSLLAGLTKFH